MTIKLVFETHSTSEDNEAGLATGWLDGRLSTRGRQNALALAERRRDDGIAVVFSSDLRRASETAEIAFAGSGLRVLLDWRLRECDYGSFNGSPVADVHGKRSQFLDFPYPGGESWRQAVERVRWFLNDLSRRWQSRRVLVVGHVATRWGLEHWLNHLPLRQLVTADFVWQEGWEYQLS